MFRVVQASPPHSSASQLYGGVASPMFLDRCVSAVMNDGARFASSCWTHPIKVVIDPYT